MKKTINRKITLAMAICLAGFIAFMGCDKKDNILDENQILDGWEISKFNLL